MIHIHAFITRVSSQGLDYPSLNKHEQGITLPSILRPANAIAAWQLLILTGFYLFPTLDIRMDTLQDCNVYT